MASVDINNNYATHSKSRNKSQIPDVAEENNLPPTQASNIIHDDEAATPSKPYSPPRDSLELLTLSDAGQNSTRMWCYVYCPWNSFLDYFSDPVPDGAVIYEGNVPFQYNKQEDMYTEFVGYPTCKVLLAASKDHDFFPSHKGNASNVSNNSNKSKKSKFVRNSSNLTQITPQIPSDL